MILWRITGKTEDSLAAFRKGLRDEDRQARRTCAIVLKDMGQAAKSLVPDLIECLQDDDKGMRAAVKEALKEIAPEAGRPARMR